MLLDGQTFMHAVFGIICGIAALVCGLGSARKDYSNETRRWLGQIMAFLGVVLAVFSVIQLPTAYQTQTRFNERSKKIREMREQKPVKTSILSSRFTSSFWNGSVPGR